MCKLLIELYMNLNSSKRLYVKPDFKPGVNKLDNTQVYPEHNDPGLCYRCVYALQWVCVNEHASACAQSTHVSLTWTSQEMDLSRYQLGSQGGSALKSKCSR